MEEVWVRVEDITPGMFYNERVVYIREYGNSYYSLWMQNHNIDESNQRVKALLLESDSKAGLVELMCADPGVERITVPIENVIERNEED